MEGDRRIISEMRVLITGSHGFVGANLIEVMSGDYEIIQWDARKDRELPDCDAVIHLAGVVHDTKKVNTLERYLEVNTELTKRMFNSFLDSRARKFVFFSSIKVEDGDTAYAKSKKAAEEYIISCENEISRQVRNDNDLSRDENASIISATKKVYILRPCMIHGKGVKGNLLLLFKIVRKGWPWPLAAFENQRSYASMGNVSYIVSELLKKDVESGVYNICDDETVSTNELIRLMGEGLGRKCKMISIPKGLVRVGAMIGDWLNLPLNTERLEKLIGNSVVDNSKIKCALGIERMPIRAEDGLELSIKELAKKSKYV